MLPDSIHLDYGRNIRITGVPPAKTRVVNVDGMDSQKLLTPLDGFMIAGTGKQALDPR